MAKQDTIALLHDLETFGLNNTLFEKIHHLGAKVKQFEAYCDEHDKFNKSGCNQRLHDRLDFMLQGCNQSALKQGKTLDDLAEESDRQIPLHRFTSCNKHRPSD